MDTNTVIPPLPAGFQLDAPQQQGMGSALPPLPPGFALDAPSPVLKKNQTFEPLPTPGLGGQLWETVKGMGRDFRDSPRKSFQALHDMIGIEGLKNPASQLFAPPEIDPNVWEGLDNNTRMQVLKDFNKDVVNESPEQYAERKAEYEARAKMTPGTLLNMPGGGLIPLAIPNDRTLVGSPEKSQMPFRAFRQPYPIPGEAMQTVQAAAEPMAALPTTFLQPEMVAMAGGLGAAPATMLKSVLPIIGADMTVSSVESIKNRVNQMLQEPNAQNVAGALTGVPMDTLMALLGGHGVKYGMPNTLKPGESLPQPGLQASDVSAKYGPIEQRGDAVIPMGAAGQDQLGVMQDTGRMLPAPGQIGLAQLMADAEAKQRAAQRLQSPAAQLPEQAQSLKDSAQAEALTKLQQAQALPPAAPQGFVAGGRGVADAGNQFAVNDLTRPVALIGNEQKPLPMPSVQVGSKPPFIAGATDALGAEGVTPVTREMKGLQSGLTPENATDAARLFHRNFMSIGFAVRAGDKEHAWELHAKNEKLKKEWFDGKTPADPDWQVTVQAPVDMGEGKKVPGYVQIDDVAGGVNHWSEGPEKLRARGYDVPDFSGLPQGKYKLHEAVEMLGEQGKQPEQQKLLSGLTTESGKDWEKFKQIAGMGAGNDWTHQGVKFVLEESGYKNPDVGVDAGQLKNRMVNKLGAESGEVKMWKALGLDEKFRAGEATTPREMAQWMTEVGPKVEVRKFGEGSQTKEQQELANLRHNFLDGLGSQNYTYAQAYLSGHMPKELANLTLERNFTEEQITKIKRIEELQKLEPNTASENSHWQSIAPKSEKDMPGYVEIAVVKSYKKTRGQNGQLPVIHEGPKDVSGFDKQGGYIEHRNDQFPSSHNFPPNTLGFVRGYMENIGGKKVFHVIEVQSDWAQQERNLRNKVDEGYEQTPEQEARDTARAKALQDPLLPHYERLALKAAIEHARKEGATKIVVSDAETAMMSEGHDRQSHDTIYQVKIGGKTIEHREGSSAYTDVEIPGLKGKTHPQDPHVIFDGKARITAGSERNPVVFSGRRNGGAEDFWNVDPQKLGVDYSRNVKAHDESGISQAKGMRLHYDRTLPKIAEELTGAKGERVEMGIHKSAVEPINADGWEMTNPLDQHGVPYEQVPRKDLIFRNPDGTPKTSVSGHAYPLGKMEARLASGEPMTTMGKMYSGLTGDTLTKEDALKIIRQVTLPDFKSKDTANELFSKPFGVEKVPLINRLWGGKTPDKVSTPQGKAIATWFAESHGVAPAFVHSVSAQFEGKLNKAFKADAKGDLNVERTKPGQSLKMSDVFEALQKDPNAYKLTEQQKLVLPIVNKVLEGIQAKVKQYGLGNIVLDEGAMSEYFPRIVTKLPDEVTAAASSPAKNRIFDTEAEGWSRGVEYATDIEQRLTASLSRLYHAIANKRLANDPALQGRTRGQLLSELKESYADELATGKMTKERLGLIADSVQSKGTVTHPLFFGKIFDAELAARMNKEFSREKSRLRELVVKTNDFLKALQLGFDFGVGQIQMLRTLFYNPRIWADSQWNGLKSMIDPTVLPEYVRQNHKVVEELAAHGSSVGSLQEMLAGLNEGRLMTQIPGLGTVSKSFARQFQTTLDVAKVEFYKAMKDVPEAERMDLIQSIESIVGASRSESIGVKRNRVLLERVALLAPSYYRSAGNTIAALGQKGVSGDMARKSMGTYLLGSVAVYVGVAAATGMDESEVKARLNPEHKNFMLWTFDVGEGRKVNIGFGGVYRSLLKLVGNMVQTSVEHPDDWESLAPNKNPVTRWYRSHAGPTVGLTWNALSGKDFIGQEFKGRDFSSLGIPLWGQDYVKSLVKGTPAPTLVDTTANIAGLVSYEEHPDKKKSQHKGGVYH